MTRYDMIQKIFYATPACCRAINKNGEHIIEILHSHVKQYATLEKLNDLTLKKIVQTLKLQPA